LADRPRVVLIGDSIRLGYQPLVTELFEDDVAIVGPAVNCGDSANLLVRLPEWCDSEAALYVFNSGLHDLLRSRSGRPRVDVAGYERNLAEIVGGLRASGPAVAFAATTPVDDERHAASGKPTRLDADVQRYNEAARRVMGALGVPVVELYALVAADRSLLAPDGVHLTAAGNAIVAEAVAAAIVRLL
jgi:acyl-CoA thioesterase-1